MSLINQMLQDLEQRMADPGATAAQVRAVSRQGKPSRARWVWLLLVLLAAAGGGVYWMSGLSVPPLHLPAPQAGPPAMPQDAAAPEPAARPDATPSVLQLAPELSLMPAAQLPAAKAESREPPVASKPGAGPAPLPAAEKPQPAVAEVKKPALAPDAPQPAGINKEIRQPGPIQRAENAYRQAYASLQQGRMGEAEESLRQALQFDPRHAAARQALAALLVESRHLDRAEQLLQQGLELQPGNTGYAMTLARIQVERKDVAAALATMQHNPPAGENAEYHGFLAALLQRSERHKEAIDHYLAALRVNPTAGPWLLGLGISLQADGQNAKAAEIYRRARQSSSLSPELQAFAEQRLKALQ